MRRAALIALCAFAGLACVASAAAASSPRAKIQTCNTALAQPDRYVVFVGKMKSLRRANRMMMRFDLYSRTAASPDWTRIDAPDLGVWHKANAGVPSYTFRQRVQGLPAPARYRARISFRWKGPKGKPQIVIKKSTSVCSQPDLRPDLRVSFQSPTVTQGQVTYSAVVRNAGKTAAGSFQLALVPGTGATQMETVAGLGPGAEVSFPVTCTQGATIQATVDPLSTVAESKEDNNTATRTCAGKRSG